MSGGGARVSIPSNVRKMIQNIKEITGNHSDEEIHAMLKECSMDPNETAQKLLSQDTGGGRNSAGRDNVTNYAAEKGTGSSLSASEEKSKETTPSASLAVVVANGPTGVVSGNSSTTHTSNLPTGSNQHEVTSSSVGVNKVGRAVSIDIDKAPTIAFGTGDTCTESMPSSSNSSMSVTPASSSTVCFSSSDPVLIPYNESRPPVQWVQLNVKWGSIELGVNQTQLFLQRNQIDVPFMQGKIPSKNQGVGKSQLSESAQPSFASIHSSGSRPSSNYSSRSQQIIGPQKAGSNKEWKPKSTNPNVAQESGTAGLSDISSIPLEASGHSQPSSGVLDSEEATAKLQKKLEDLHLPQRQHVIIPHHIHVPESERTKLSFGSFDASFGVTPSYVSAPESDKSSTPVSETSQGIEEPVEEQAESNQNTLVTAEEGIYPDHPQSPPSHVPGNLSAEGDVSSNAVPDYESKQEAALLSGGHPYSVVHTSPSYSFGFVPPMIGSQIASFENSESQARDVSRLPSFVVQQPFDPTSYYAQVYRSSADSDGRVSPFPAPGVASKYNGNVAVLPPHSSQSPQEGMNYIKRGVKVGHLWEVCGYNFRADIIHLGNKRKKALTVRSKVVFGSFYHLLNPVPSFTEGGNSLVLSTAGPTPLVTQASGLMQSSIAVTQQPVPVFRPPTGLHISHFPPNYIPYGHYFSPFYVPPPGIHQFLSNGAFPQQPQAGSVYAPPSAAATGVKYSLPQYKPGTNTGNATHIGMPSGYGPYGSSPAGYNPSSAATGGNSTTNEDLGASQFKESNVYITGQQLWAIVTEGSAVWIATPGRDISSLPASSFYNLPPQGQHVTFAPTQAAHGTFTNIYHPGQPATAATVHPLLQQSQAMGGAVDMVGPGANVYQQPQHQQINWPSNY
ncbi:unnamed protein product [Dovyalis caffra]|uniref:GBF-interacting protein 1 N-terminal domain-containing protein n=1 Tax=Dovyalis caffra TaxID=77055 RepID=A0AAV1SD06_9ROSI|nr:unnamed protein product [Dovyalis caffra]